MKICNFGQKVKKNLLRFYCFYTLSLRNKETITTMYLVLIYDQYFSRKCKKVSFPVHLPKLPKFRMITPKVFVVKQIRIHGCDRLFIL